MQRRSTFPGSARSRVGCWVQVAQQSQHLFPGFGYGSLTNRFDGTLNP